MELDSDARAYEALSQHARIVDLATIALAIMARASDARQPEVEPSHAQRLATDRNLSREDAVTPFGNALDVLVQGPENHTERSLARALAAHAIARRPPGASDDTERQAASVLWLATHTWFDATGLVDRALGDRAVEVWEAFATRIRRHDDGAAAPFGRAEALAAAVALARSPAPSASRLAASLGSDVQDPVIAYVLLRADDPGAVPPLVGEWTASPRGSFATAVLGLTGLSLVMNVARLVGRVAFAYRRPAEVVLSDDGGIRVRWRVELLGRTLRDRDVVVPRSALARASRDVRYPRLALYAALLALAMGSYVGVAAFVDGIRATSPSLVTTGLAIVAIGFALDLALTSVAPGARGRCRVLFVPRRGSSLCVGAVDIASADAILTRLSRRSVARDEAG
jgi:hypothetical protein